MTAQRFDPAVDTLGWWRNQADLHPPETPAIAAKMDNVRGWYRSLGELLIEELPPGPDRTVALRSLKSALMDSIGAIATNQWYWDDDDEQAAAGES